MLVLLTTLLVTLVGYLFLSFWKDEFCFLEKLSLGFGLGIGFITLWMFFLGVVKIPFSQELIFYPLLGLIGLFLAFLIPRGRVSFPILSQPKRIGRFNIFQAFFFFLIVILVSWSFLQTFVWPPFEWDALALYDFRALRFFETLSLAESILAKPLWLATYTYSYPLFTSLAHTLVYLMDGANPKFIYSLIYLSLLVGFYYSLRRRVSVILSLGVTALLATTPSFIYHSTIAYSNLAYTFYFALGTIYFWEWATYKKSGYFWVSALFLGLSTWVRSQDPFWMANLLILIIYCYKTKQLKWIFPYAFIFFAIRQSWSIYRSSVYSQIENLQEVPLGLAIDFGKIFTVIPFVIQNVIVDWRALALLFATIFVWGGKKRLKQNWYIIGLLLLYLLMIFAGTYYLSINLWWWSKIGGSASRMSMFFFPFILYATVAIFFTSLNYKKKTKDSIHIKFKFNHKFKLGE